MTSRTPPSAAPRHPSGALRRLVPLAAALALIALALAPGVADARAPVRFVRVAAGLDMPLFATGAGDGTGRLFIVEQPGRIKILAGGTVRSTPFLDLRSLTSCCGEQGLLGLAFHPLYASNGRFFVDYTDLHGDTVVAEYHRSAGDPNVAATTARVILRIGQPYANHNGGMLAFGRDGYLYIGTGDGGSAGDPGNRAQSVNSLLGKILRIDVNGTSGSRQYRIPSTNPYVGHTGLDEIFMRGLRNPWRFSFDRQTGDLWVGDVGQGRYEEVDRFRRASGNGRGANLGWRVMEGRHCYLPSSGCSTSGKTFPIVEYSHRFGCAVTGGYVYHGAAIPWLRGWYVYGDYCSGRIWRISSGAPYPATARQIWDTAMNISSFAQDDRGELYVVDLRGNVWRMLDA